MTAPYEFFDLPNNLAIKCPNCGSEAVFRFAVAVKATKDAQAEFDRSEYFELVRVQDPQIETYVLYFDGLAGLTGPNDKDLPQGYKSADFEQPKTLPRAVDIGRGVMICPNCNSRKKHTLDWPKEAYFQVTIGPDSLWGFGRKYVEELLDYIASENRDRKKYVYSVSFRHIPSVFLTKKNRAEVIKKLKKILLT